MIKGGENIRKICGYLHVFPFDFYLTTLLFQDTIRCCFMNAYSLSIKRSEMWLTTEALRENTKVLYSLFVTLAQTPTLVVYHPHVCGYTHIRKKIWWKSSQNFISKLRYNIKREDLSLSVSHPFPTLRQKKTSTRLLPLGFSAPCRILCSSMVW